MCYNNIWLSLHSNILKNYLKRYMVIVVLNQDQLVELLSQVNQRIDENLILYSKQKHHVHCFGIIDISTQSSPFPKALK